MSRFDHSVSVGDARRYTKVAFVIEEEPGGSESMWVEALSDGTFRIKNIPAWVSGVSFDDVIVSKRRDGEVWFDKVKSRGGHSTYRLAFQDPAGPQGVQPEFDALQALGCGFERISPRFIALDVPPETDVIAVYRALEDGMASGRWWFDELHYGHEAPRSAE